MGFNVHKELFWVQKENVIHVVKLESPATYCLEGVAAEVFLSITENKFDESSVSPVQAKVVRDLLSLQILCRS